jgi:TPR repeat protein
MERTFRVGAAQARRRRAAPESSAHQVPVYRRAAASGNKSALLRLGICYAKGGPGVAYDRLEADAWFERAYEAGEPQAISTL